MSSRDHVIKKNAEYYDQIFEEMSKEAVEQANKNYESIRQKKLEQFLLHKEKDVSEECYPSTIKSSGSVSDMLKQSADLYDQRNLIYGSAYKRQGCVMTALFPDGISLRSIEDFNRFTILSTIVSKIVRYTNDFSRPHDDSVLDCITYFAMLRELDLKVMNKNSQKTKIEN